MSKSPSEKLDQFHLKLPDGMRDMIKQAALANGRTMTAEIIARIDQQLECGGFAGSGFGGVLGNALGQHPQLARVADVLLVVVGLGIEVRKVGEQQHDEHDQGDKQHDDLRTTARPFHWLSGIGCGHRSGPEIPY